MALFEFHKMGWDVRGASSIGEVLERGGIDYDVARVPVAATLSDGQHRTIDGKWATVRTDTGKPLGIVGSRYRVVQNADAFGFTDGAIKAGDLKPERAGTFDGGARAWVLSKFNGTAEPVKGDVVDTHLLTLTGHDGSCCVTVMPVTFRQVCTNGLTVCEGRDALAITIRHGHSTQDRIDKFGNVLKRLHDRTSTFFQCLERLAKVSMPETAVRGMFEMLFPPQPPKAVEADGAGLLEMMLDGSRGEMGAELAKADSAYNARILNQLMDNYHAESATGTAWGALNAVTEYSTHQMRTKGGDEGRLESVLLGNGADLGRRAFALANQLV